LKKTKPSDGIPRRPFGQTGSEVSILGIGGSAIGSAKSENIAHQIVHEGMDGGINFLDNAWEYHDGKSEIWMGRALKGRRDKAFLMTKVCSHGRDGKVALKQLEDSLRRLKTDYLDLWQIHEVVYDSDPELHFARGGAVEALEKARKQGKVRYVGFTGHKDPSIHLKMLSFGFAFDACQMPLNPFDATFRSFERQVLPELLKRGIAPIEEALRYALSLPISVLVSGMDSLTVLRKNMAIAREFTSLSSEAAEALRKRCAPFAADGRFERYKTSKEYDADVGRKQHGFPSLKQSAD
jgi:predicted aldo/keto reductase-like oxidoreductase